MKARKHIALIGSLVSLAALVGSEPTRAQLVPPGVGDVVLAFDEPRSFANMEVSGAGDARVRMTSSLLSLNTSDALCDRPGCTYTLNRLDMQFSDLTIGARVTGEIVRPFPLPNIDFDERGTFLAQQVSASIAGPLAVSRSGKVIVVPRGTPVSVSMVVSGNAGGENLPARTIVNTNPLTQDLLIELDTATQVARVDGLVNFTVNDSGISIATIASVHGVTGSPFANLPPVAEAGPPQSHQCPGVVTLNATGTTDKQGNIVSYRWDAGAAGSVESSAPTANLFLGFGQHNIVLTVTDAFGAKSSDTVSITVADTTPPQFTFVPAAVTVSSCVDPSTGEATVSDNCGQPVTLIDNSPAKFPLGPTTVTWTATDQSGNSATAHQLVTAVLRDDPSCCPNGTNVLVGTAGPDVLIGTNGSDCILGLQGDDQINAFKGADFVSGGAGRDTIATHEGNDYVVGGDGNDTIDSGPGDDFLDGNAGVDTCSGGGGTDAISCEVASFCTAACCATQTCAGTPPQANECGPAYAQNQCLSYVLGSVVSRSGHNWRCSNGNCSNCATFASCAPGASNCPWGVVWVDHGTCE